MADTPDPVAAALAEIQERAGAAAAMDVDVLSAFSGVSVGGVIAASAVDVPRLLAAVKAALGFHENFSYYCGSCLDAYGDRIEWPCEEYRAITAALAGKG